MRVFNVDSEMRVYGLRGGMEGHNGKMDLSVMRES